MKTYDNYIAVMPADEAIFVVNLLANIGIALEGLTLTVNEAPDDPLFSVTPQMIHRAWKAVDTALHDNWLGASEGAS